MQDLRPHHRKELLVHSKQHLMSDYYTLEEIPAKEAFYVLDADVFGPMGHELLPFKSQKSAMDTNIENSLINCYLPISNYGCSMPSNAITILSVISSNFTIALP